MCGIVGRYNFLTHVPVSEEVLHRACDMLMHRGPDGQGIYAARELGLGHRRLAVIDLSDAGRQPMVSEDGGCAMTYNGEIYNFHQLRRTLQGRGYRFRSHTDTEVVLAAYCEYGTKCVEHLRGMFAFAIWDARERRLFLARDRVGKKPLYYRLHQDGISFASEPKAFLAEPDFRPEVHPPAISHYLTYQYVPPPLSAFQDVYKLPPGHRLIVQDGELTVERYWALSYRRPYRGSFEDAKRELLEKLKQATELRLVSDVPLGAFLSGGIDSSVIVACMAELGHQNIKTFSIGFEEQAYNELPHAKTVAERYATDHHEYVVTPRATELFDKLVWHYGEPFADSSAIPSFYLSEMTRQHVTVALNGDGGDESLFGYDRYVASHYGARYDRWPLCLRRIVERGVRYLPDSSKSKTLLNRVKRFMSVLSETPEHRYGHWMCHFDPLTKQQLCTQGFRDVGAAHDSFELLGDVFRASDAEDFLSRVVNTDVEMYLPGDLLVKVDIATMAHSLEARSPFLDHEVMELCASLPPSMKLHAGEKKYVLKEAVKTLLPREVLDRPKMGFGVPLDVWFRSELKEMAYDVLLSDRALQRGYFHQSMVQRLLDEHTAGVRAWHYQLWNLLMLELWHRMYIDGDRLSFVANV